MELSETGPAVRNPDVWIAEPRGMRATRFDHCALNGVDISASAKIFVDALDFSVTEELVDESTGARLGIFLSCSRSEEHTSELQSLMRISYAVFCLKKKTHIVHHLNRYQTHPAETDTQGQI